MRWLVLLLCGSVWALRAVFVPSIAHACSLTLPFCCLSAGACGSAPPFRAVQMFDVLSAVTLSGLTLSRPPTCANPKTLLGGKLVVCQGSEGNAVKRVTPAMRDPYQYIRSGHYRQILCGASGVPGGIDGSCQQRPQ